MRTFHGHETFDARRKAICRSGRACSSLGPDGEAPEAAVLLPLGAGQLCSLDVAPPCPTLE